MILGPNPAEQVNRARADLRMGVPIVLCEQDRATLFLAAEGITSDRLLQVRSLGSPIVALTARRAETLKIAAYDGDLVRLILPEDAGCSWVHDIADPAHDLDRPLKGPFRAVRDGSARAARTAILIAKSAHLLPAAVLVPVAEGRLFATTHGLTCLDLAQIEPELATSLPFMEVAGARVPLIAAEATRVHVFRSGSSADDHYAIEIGSPARDQPVLARLHSACFTGDVLGSLKCDCGAQLAAALAQMGEAGAGILLYLNQEGRGIGLANKMRAYSLQDQGFDTVEANHRLGFEDDERDFRVGADILRRMGFSAVRLLTNNPRKIAMMEKMGVRVVERVALQVGKTRHNEAYLATKARKSGHLL